MCQQNSVSFSLLLLHPLLTLERQLLFLHQHLKAQLAAFSLPNTSSPFPLADGFQRPLCSLDFILFCLWIFTCPLMFGNTVRSYVSWWSLHIKLLCNALINGPAFLKVIVFLKHHHSVAKMEWWRQFKSIPALVLSTLQPSLYQCVSTSVHLLNIG